MAQKRSRTAFETDSASPYVLYGTPLPPLDPDVRDDGSYVPIWKQEVTDERGRKRLHGAFTGGFSAGYFNTVGSKEGWTPSTFVSSRSKRAKDQPKPTQQRPEDFMDEEDLAEAAESKKLQTAESFSGIGASAEDTNKRNTLVDLMRAGGTSMGAKLLQKMGWREGQGVGPKIRRKARLEEESGQSESGNSVHLFAPENTKMVSFVRKTDFKGLGFAGEVRLSDISTGDGHQQEDDDDDTTILSRSRSKPSKGTVEKKSGFGVGILNDTGSDEDDPFEMGPKISYNRTIGPTKKGKKSAKPVIRSSNPLLSTKPVFVSKKKTASGFRKCHDGRLPLEGFILSIKPLDLSKSNAYPPPKVPAGWKSSKTPSEIIPLQQTSSWQSTSDAAKASTIDPAARASLLGESLLPGKSVFDYLNPAARTRIAAASGRADLPTARSEAPPSAYRKSDFDKQKQLWARVPELDKELALGALNRGQSGWMPYAEDESKRARYRSFLEIRAGLRDVLPERAPGVSVDEWVKEMHEFAQAAQVFRPMTGVMASRFTSSSKTFEGSFNGDPQAANGSSLIRVPTGKPEDPAEAAAKIGMYGPMTRSMHGFLPTRLVCKRFGVRPPDSVDLDPGAMGGDVGVASTVSEVVSQSVMDQMMREAAVRRPAQTRDPEGTGEFANLSVSEPVAVVDVEKNEALEAERPGDAVFKAIFGSDDDDDSD